MRTTTSLPLMVLVALSAGACKNDSTLATVVKPNQSDLVTLEGRVCDPDRGAWLEGAEVYMNLFDSDGALYRTISDETDADGRYQLVDVPIDTTSPVFVQYGNTVLDQFEVQIPPGQTYVVLPDPVCGGTTGSLAVVTGDYDDFASVLEDMGFGGDFDVVNGQTGDELVQFLTNDTALAGYQAVLFGGGHLEEDVIYDTDGSDVAGDVPRVLASIQAYVEGGGVIIVTDWSYDLVEQIRPAMLEFSGDDTIPDSAQLGEANLVTASIVDDALATSLGQSEVNVNYDLIEYPIIDSAADPVTVYLTGDVDWRVGEETGQTRHSPLLIGFSVGSGYVWLSTFRFGANTETTGKDVIRSILNGL